jgi:phenylalanyl-tRNA synthetase beta chain
MQALGRNYSRKLENAAAFEIGSVFRCNKDDAQVSEEVSGATEEKTSLSEQIPGCNEGKTSPSERMSFSDEEEELPIEQMSLSIGAYGDGMDFFGLKGAVCELFNKLGIQAEFKANPDIPFYHPGRSALVFAGEELLGFIGEIHPDVSDSFGIDKRCWAGELNMQKITELANITRSYAPLPRYPSVDRDIALLVSEDTEVKNIEDVIRQVGGKLLERVRLFDVYRGKQVDEGKKSTAFSLIYRSYDRTLTDDEITIIQEKIIKALKERMGAILRDS